MTSLKSFEFFRRYGIFLIIILAAALRLVNIQEAFYGTTTELFRDINVVYDMVQGGKSVLVGPSASLGGFYFGAVYYYLLAPIVWALNFLPVGAVLTATIFSLLELVMLYLLLKKWGFSFSTTLLGVFLLAISVFEIQNSYYISNPNPIPFFMLCYLYLMTLFLRGDRRFSHGLSLGLVAGILTQLHATALLLLPVLTLATVLVYKPKIYLRHTLYFACGLVLVYVPYLIYEFQHDFSNLRRILVLGGGNFGLVPKIASLGAIGNFLGSTFIFANGYFSLWFSHRQVGTGLTVLIVLSALFLILSRRRGRSEDMNKFVWPEIWLIHMWFAIGLLMFLFYQNPIPTFYFLVLWPAPIIYLIWLIEYLYLQKSKLSVWSLVGVFLIVQMTQLIFFYPTLKRPELLYTSFEEIFQTVEIDAKEQSFNIISVGTSQKVPSQTNALVYYAKLYGLPDREQKVMPELLYLVSTRDDSYQLPVSYEDRNPRVVYESSYYKVVRVDGRF